MTDLLATDPGLTPRPMKAQAVYTGVTVTLLAMFACMLFVLVAPPRADFFVANRWISGVTRLLDYRKSLSLLQERWIVLIATIASSIAAGAYAAYDAWVQAPLIEPFDTPNPADGRIYYDEDARLKLRARFEREAGRRAGDGIWLAPHLNMPFRLETRNIMVVGASGHGKSNIVRAHADQMIRRGDLVGLHCNKGDVTQSFDLNDVILISPAHRNGWAWDIAADIDGPAAAAEFAKDVIPASDQPFWSDSARLILADTISAMNAERGTSWSPGDLLLALYGDPQKLRAQISQIDLNVSPLFGQGDDSDALDRTVKSIMSTLFSAATYALRPMAYAWANIPPEKRFSIKAWLRDDGLLSRILIVQTSPNFAEMSTTVCGGILRRICTAMSDPSMHIDPNRRVNLVLDEMYSLGRVEDLARSLSVGREKGLVCVAALQTQYQLNDLYGDEAELLMDMFQMKIYTGLVAGPSAELAEKTMGQRDIIWSVPNRHPGKDDVRKFLKREEKVPVVSAVQLTRDLGVFENDEGKEYVRAMIHYSGAVYRFDWPLTVWKKVGEGFVPAKWTQYVSKSGPPQT
ncbi:Type IV secretory pathway, VirD4 component, TraG/TraD family ATPase [Tardiphaga sp. OK246]|uniref:type IV secretion system DNA-binding domain-containing protein n=1 Tax=Tardiphaga sp. OK246 TaxID=1855307 RepID=UPI000B63F1AF|nr:type IV secretion system DNA-binding domain-containing protein [Tardiphaga sp. OK246]SNT32427.1 Type IV secretory pathway, VirD4 component, TraG/TraD family ATPase [Tardiphaga sp. OK246]